MSFIKLITFMVFFNSSFLMAQSDLKNILEVNTKVLNYSVTGNVRADTSFVESEDLLLNWKFNEDESLFGLASLYDWYSLLDRSPFIPLVKSYLSNKPFLMIKKKEIFTKENVVFFKFKLALIENISYYIKENSDSYYIVNGLFTYDLESKSLKSYVLYKGDYLEAKSLNINIKSDLVIDWFDTRVELSFNSLELINSKNIKTVIEFKNFTREVIRN